MVIFMLMKIFLFLLGYALTVIGFVYLISYLNLMYIGYNFFEYVYFILRRLECYYVVIGIILICFSMGGKNELHI